MKTLTLANSEGVLTVTMVRTDVHNAFNEDMIREVTDVFQNIGHDVLAVVLASSSKSFSAGADLTWMGRMTEYTYEQNVADAEQLAVMFHALRHCPCPLIGRINGTALGGGAGLVACCDIAIAVEAATFGFTEVRLGIIPAVISPFVIEKIGAGAARRYFVTAERFSAKVACSLGLVHEIVPDLEALDAAITTIVKAITENGPHAVRSAKHLVDAVVGLDWHKAGKTTAQLIAERRVSAEGQEGMRAFLQRRPPQWR